MEDLPEKELPLLGQEQKSRVKKASNRGQVQLRPKSAIMNIVIKQECIGEVEGYLKGLKAEQLS